MFLFNFPRSFRYTFFATLVVLILAIILFASNRVTFFAALINPHSQAGYIGLLIFSAAIFISFFVLLISVPKAAFELFRDLTLRTRFLIVVPVCGFLAWLLIAIWIVNLAVINTK